MGKGKDGALECCAACGACACCCFVVLLVLGLASLGIAKIVMGAIYFHDCDLEPLIPIFLIVGGCAPILFGGFGGQNQEGQDEGCTAGKICGFIGFLFNLAWLICGSVWIYPNYGKLFADDYVPCMKGNETKGCTKTCNEVLMKFSFAMVTIDWVFIGLWVVLIGCMICRACKN